jgi:hypothetical protein
MDDLRTALAEIAPEVDTATALAAFHERRRRDRRRRRAGAAMAVAAVLAIVVLVASGVGRGDSKVAVTAGPDTGSQPSTLLPDRDFTVLTVQGGDLDSIGKLRSAVNQDELDDLWAALIGPGAPRLNGRIADPPYSKEQRLRVDVPTSETGKPGTNPTTSTGAAGTGVLGADQLRAIARRAAENNGEQNPTHIEWVKSTLDKAEEFMSRDIGDFGSDEVFVVQAQGSFVAEAAPRPQGASAPTGTTLTLIVDATTGEVRGSALLHSPLDLSTLGPVEH